MNKLFVTALSLIAALAAVPATAADDFYLGAAIGTQGKLTFSNGAGTMDNTNHPRAYSLYGGYVLSERFAIEAGYSSFGDFKFGSVAEADLSALHLAAKASFPVSDAWSVFGKAGVVRHSIDITNSGRTAFDMTKVRGLLGVGVEYHQSPKLSVALELVDYGKVREPGLDLKTRELQAGVNYRF